jgi:alkenylglycerophosphocholine/alkenylglycerophosphoethanolamine hydrolase
MALMKPALLVAFIAPALIYWVSLFTAGFPGDWAVKALPMWVAAVVMWTELPRRFGLPMALGFLAASAGDIFLALDRQAFLLQALLCFLVTQLAYSTAFIQAQRPGPRLAWRLPLVAYGLGLLAWMWPGLGDFAVPVSIYVAVLITMTWLGAGVEDRPGRLVIGCSLFVIADSLIGVNRFVQPFPAAEIVIVALYTTGQFLILLGARRALRPWPKTG